MSTSKKSVEGKPKGLLRAVSVVGSMTLLSRITGLARDVAFSHWFGAGVTMDAFFIAFKIPNLLRRFFAEGAFSQAFVPVISEYRTTRSPQEIRELIDRTSGTLALILFVVTVLGVVSAPILIMIFAPGFLDEGPRYGLARDMLRFTFPYIFFISLTALCGAILNSYQKFAAPAFTPVLLNLVLIGFAGWVAPDMARPAIGLAVGVFVAGVIQLTFQAAFLVRLKLLPQPRWGWAHDGVRKILKLMGPVIFGSSVAQINILFDTLVASFLVAGSISWLYYSDRLMEFPLGMFGVALATVILPNLSQQHARGSGEAFSDVLDWALRLVLIIGLPATLGLMALAGPLLTTIFFSGAFTERDVAMASASLIAYAFGLVAFILIKVLSAGFFARQDTRTPVRIAVMALVLNMLFNVIFVVTMVRSGFFAPHAGLAAATTLSAFFNAGLLLRALRAKGVYLPRLGWGRLFVRVIISCTLMTMSIVWLREQVGDWIELSLLDRVQALAACVLVGMMVYFFFCYLLGMRPKHLRLRDQGSSI